MQHALNTVKKATSSITSTAQTSAALSKSQTQWLTKESSKKHNKQKKARLSAKHFLFQEKTLILKLTRSNYNDKENNDSSRLRE